MFLKRGEEMNVTIHEILSLKSFNKFRLLAGVNGLDRIVSRGGFIDHESAEDMRKIAYIDEMIFSNLPMIIGEPEKITDYLLALIEAKCSCFAIKTTFFKTVPEEAIMIANEHNFPLFLFDDTYIEDLILDIDSSVNDQKQIAKKLLIVEEIENGSLNASTIKNYAYELNRHFKNNILVCYVKESQVNKHSFDVKLAQKVLGNAALVLPTQDSFLMILSYNESESIDIEATLNVLGLRKDDYHVGISELTNNLGLLSQALFQSKTALKFACYQNTYLSDFKEIGIYQLLFPLFDNPYAIQYYDAIIEKLVAHDEVYQSDLLDTARAYIKSDGDIKGTADIMFQHANTIRYRIKKIKSLLDFDQINGMKYETLAVAIHLYELNNNRYKFSPL